VRVVGVNPHPDALNATASNGSSVCRVVSVSYNAETNSADLDLDALPWSVYRLISWMHNPWLRRLPRPKF
jgi:hypothetical protein